MQGKHFLAFDLGASSGRAILGTLQNEKLELTEIHRFENQMQQINGHFFGTFSACLVSLKQD